MTLIDRFDHVLYYLLGIPEDHHGFIHVKEFIVEASKTKDLEQHQKKNKKAKSAQLKNLQLKLNFSGPNLGQKKE